MVTVFRNLAAVIFISTKANSFRSLRSNQINTRHQRTGIGALSISPNCERVVTDTTPLRRWTKKENSFSLEFSDDLIGTSGSNLWNELVPCPLTGKKYIVTVECDDARRGAEDLATKCFSLRNGSLFKEKRQKMINTVIRQLEYFLQQFQSIAERELQVDCDAVSYQARVVATRGHAGQRCPRFHYDHVPLRWVQSLGVGPGCEYVVGEEGLRRELFSNFDSRLQEDLKESRVDLSVADIRRARPWEAVVLLGTEGTALPTVHRSPELNHLEGRVLLTLDVIPKKRHECGCC